MNEIELRQSVAQLLVCTFARSSGPGGQNVNKVNTKVRAIIHIDDLLGVTETEKVRIKERLASRIDQEGILSVTVDTERSQQRNRDIAYDRMIQLIISSATIPKRRVATKATRASKIKRLESKKKRGTLKAGRSWTPGSE